MYETGRFSEIQRNKRTVVVSTRVQRKLNGLDASHGELRIG